MIRKSIEGPDYKYERTPVSHDQLQSEYAYFLAQRVLDSMLKNNLISLSEHKEITKLNRVSFSPMFAQLMPDTVDICLL